MQRAWEVTRHIGSGLATVTRSPDLPSAPRVPARVYKRWNTAREALHTCTSWNADGFNGVFCVSATVTAVNEEGAKHCSPT